MLLYVKYMKNWMLTEGTSMHLLEHEASRWLSYEDLDSVDWLPADAEVVKAVKKELLNR